MTIFDEAKLIRNEVAKLRPDKRRRYSAELQGRILDWVRRAMASGWAESDCGKALGIKTWRFRMWRRQASAPSESVALVPIEIEQVVPGTTISLITPAAYRVEGLTLDQVARLLRDLT